MTEFAVLRDLGFVVVGAALLLLAVRPLRFPPILTYMVGGLLLGPLLGLLEVSHSLEILSELGIALLLFVVGLELSLEKIRDVGGTAVVTGLVQVATVAAGGFGIARLLGLPGTTALLVGLVAAFSSTVVVVKLLDRQGDLGSLHGRLAIGILLVQDILVAVVLTLLTGLGGGEGPGGGALLELGGAFLALGALAAVGAAAVKWVLPPLYAWLRETPEAVFVVSLTWAFAFILGAEAVHISVELGAFIAGVLLAQLPHTDELRRRVHPLVDFFLAVFFVSLGANMDPGSMGQWWPAALLVGAFVLVGKPLILAVLLGLLGRSRRVSLLAGLTLGQVSEFSFILTALAVEVGVVGPEFLGFVGLVGFLTIGTSAVLVPRGPALVDRLEGAGLLRLLPGTTAEAPPPRVFAGHVVVVGMNSLGRTLVERFHALGERVLAVDTDPGKLAGLPSESVVGNAALPAVLEEAGIPRAKLVVSALQIEDANSLLAWRAARLGVPVSIHAFDPAQVHELLEIGADHLMISKLDGIGPMEEALQELGVYGP